MNKMHILARWLKGKFKCDLEKWFLNSSLNAVKVFNGAKRSLTRQVSSMIHLARPIV